VSSVNTGLAVINTSGINIAQGLDIIVEANTCIDTRGTPQQIYGIQIGQVSFPGANSEPNRVTVANNRITGYVTAKINRASATYTTDYVEIDTGITLATGSVALLAGTLSIGTSAATKPLNIAANSSEDLLQIKNYAGTDKWHLATTGGTALDIIETGVASRFRLAAGGGATLSGLLTAGSLSAGAGSLTSLNLDGSGSSAAAPGIVKGSASFNDLIGFKNNAGTLNWTITEQAGGTDLDFTEAGVANNRLHLKAGGHVGIGTSAPTAWLDLPTSTTSEAALRIRSGSAPTSPNSGDVWFDGTHLQARLGSTTYQLDQQIGSGSFAPVGGAYVTIGTDATLTSERALTGTSNQITVTDGGAGGNVTLSLPQSIHTGATPSFAGLTLDGSASTALPLLIYASQTNNDALKIRNNAGTDKWHITLGSGGTDLDFTESGVAKAPLESRWTYRVRYQLSDCMARPARRHYFGSLAPYSLRISTYIAQ